MRSCGVEERRCLPPPRPVPPRCVRSAGFETELWAGKILGSLQGD